jgi:hypothetical protein
MFSIFAIILGILNPIDTIQATIDINTDLLLLIFESKGYLMAFAFSTHKAVVNKTDKKCATRNNCDTTANPMQSGYGIVQ